MTRRYFTLAALSLLALQLVGCGDDNEPIATAKLDPLKQDDEDRALNEPDPVSPAPSTRGGDYEADIELFPGESWTAAEEQNSYAAAAMRFSRKGTYDTYGTRNGGRQAWRIPKVGRAGGKALVRFPSGRQYLVTLGKANRSNKGFVFKKGSHGGWYIHACYGDRSKTVTVYWS